ncbi:MAG: hypothetical protein QGH40_10310 [bacterium]|jgi:hypothetical protein|nr:hypothetical protein [bacterium]
MNNDGFIQEIIRKIDGPDPAISKAALLISQDMVDARFLEPLLKKSESDSREVRQLAQDMIKNIVQELGISAEELKELQVKVRLECAREQLNQAESRVRREAVEYIVQYAPPEERCELLFQRLRFEAVPEVLCVLITALAGFQHPDMAKLMLRLLEAESEEVRVKAAEVLLRQEGGRYFKLICEFMETEGLQVQSSLAREMCLDPYLVQELDFDFTTTRIVKNLFSDRLPIRQAALKELEKIEPSQRKIPVLAALSDPDSGIQFLAKKLLSQEDVIKKKSVKRTAKKQVSHQPLTAADDEPAYHLYVALTVIAVSAVVYFWFMARGGTELPLSGTSEPAAGGGHWTVDQVLYHRAALEPGNTEVEFMGRVSEVTARGDVLVMKSDNVRVSVKLSSFANGRYKVGQRLTVKGLVSGITRFGTVVVEASDLE